MDQIKKITLKNRKVIGWLLLVALFTVAILNTQPGNLIQGALIEMAELVLGIVLLLILGFLFFSDNKEFEEPQRENFTFIVDEIKGNSEKARWVRNLPLQENNDDMKDVYIVYTDPITGIVGIEYDPTTSSQEKIRETITRFDLSISEIEDRDS